MCRLPAALASHWSALANSWASLLYRVKGWGGPGGALFPGLFRRSGGSRGRKEVEVAWQAMMTVRRKGRGYLVVTTSLFQCLFRAWKIKELVWVVLDVCRKTVWVIGVYPTAVQTRLQIIRIQYLTPIMQKNPQTFLAEIFRAVLALCMVYK